MFAARARRSILILGASSVFAVWPATAPAQMFSMENLPADGSFEQCGRTLSLEPQKFVEGEFLSETTAGISLTAAKACDYRAKPEPPAASPALVDDPLLSPPITSSTGKPAPASPTNDRSVVPDRGSQAATIARARTVVLDVLQNENACSSWLEKRDLHVLDTFSSLRFWVDRDGPARIVKEKGDNGDWVEHGPYVAMTVQGTGAYTNVALNANGAFFQASSLVSKILWHNGPRVETTARQPLHVGPFDGATLDAQVITLIHELAHVVNAIPRDGLTPTGLVRSQENTELILGHCKRAAKDGAKRVLAAEASSGRSRAAATD